MQNEINDLARLSMDADVLKRFNKLEREQYSVLLDFIQPGRASLSELVNRSAFPKVRQTDVRESDPKQS